MISLPDFDYAREAAAELEPLLAYHRDDQLKERQQLLIKLKKQQVELNAAAKRFLLSKNKPNDRHAHSLPDEDLELFADLGKALMTLLAGILTRN